MQSGTAGEPNGSASEFTSLEDVNNSIERVKKTYEAMEPVWKKFLYSPPVTFEVVRRFWWVGERHQIRNERTQPCLDLASKPRNPVHDLKMVNMVSSARPNHSQFH